MSKIIRPIVRPLMKTLAQRRRNIVDLTKRAPRLLKASINFVQQRWAKPNRLKHSTISIHIYEIRPRADKRGFDLMAMRSHTVRCGIAAQTQSGIQSVTRSFTATHMMPVIRVYDDARNVIETHDHAVSHPPAGADAEELKERSALLELLIRVR